MPKQVDHRERRAHIADALLRIAAEKGLEEVSLRHVAAEAGVSAGMVQHYFRTKDEMMQFAMDRVAENVTARLGSSPTASLREVFVQMLPLDAARRVEVQVSLAFVSYAFLRPTVGVGLRESIAQMRAHVAERIRIEGRSVDPDLAATALLALVDGLAVHVLGRTCSGEEALAILDGHLAGLFGPDGASTGGVPGVLGA